MIEEKIIEWLELGDSIQKIDIFDKNNMIIFFKGNYLLTKHNNFSQNFYFFVIAIFFSQIWEINLLRCDIEGDKILEIINYFKNIFLFQYLIKNNTILLIFTILCEFISVLLFIINVILFNYQKKFSFLININAFINFLNVFFIFSPSLEILFQGIICLDGIKYKLCPLNSISSYIKIILTLIYAIILIFSVLLSCLYIDSIGSIYYRNSYTKINSNYTLIIINVKMIFSILYFIIDFCIDKKYKLITILYELLLFLSSLSISIYSYSELFYYNYYIDAWFHYGWYYTTWFNICILIKNLGGLQDISLFVVFGLILITIGFNFDSQYRAISLLTDFNVFNSNKIKEIQIYNALLLFYLRRGDNESLILTSGIIDRIEEYLRNMPEMNEQYHKLLDNKHLQKIFTSKKELSILSIILIIYYYHIEKSKNSIDMTLNFCYFLINEFKNIPYAIWLCTKLKTSNHMQSYYKFALMEEIKEYLIGNLIKNSTNFPIKNIQISSVLLFNQYLDLFKMKIYDTTCSQIEYFDILKNNIATSKTTENFLKTGEEILSLRKDISNLWEKLIFLNPFNSESEKDYMTYIKVILQDDILMRTEQNKYNSLKNEKLSERNNLYYSMFDNDLSAVLLIDGYSYNGKIFYTTTNFASLFMFSGKEILNTTIDDLLPDIIQNFHRYLIEDVLKYSNLDFIFNKQKDVLFKGKNGQLFNIYLYIKPVPNLLYGLIYFAYIKKFQEKHFILILDQNLIINGFTGINQIDSNFTMNNNYGLSNNICGHHIGLLIPEILQHIKYDERNNSIYLPHDHIDYKGFLYPIHYPKELDNRITNILDIMKNRKNDEFSNENQLSLINEYNELIKELNLQYSNPINIFYRIQLQSFIGGKYKYYRIYVKNDLLSGNENNLIIKSNNNTEIAYGEKKISKKRNSSQIKLNEIKEKITNNQNNKGKLIKLKEVLNENNIINDNELNMSDIDEDNNNKSALNNNQNKIIKISNSSIPSSIITQSNGESAEINKLKNEIINKADFFYIKLMKYMNFFFILIILILIIYDYYSNYKNINAMIEFLSQNSFFIYTKINAGNIYNYAFDIKLMKREIMKKSYSTYFSFMIKTCLTEIRKQKYNISYYYSDFKKIFNQKTHTHLYIYNKTSKDELDLDIDNFLNLIITHGMKIIDNLSDYLNSTNKEDIEIYETYLNNLLANSLQYFYSDYTGFSGKIKEKICQKISNNFSFIFLISCIYIFLLIYIFIYLICQMNSIELNFLDKLIYFSSSSFDEYIKNLDELKKVIRNETDNEEDKNMDEFDIKEGDINDDSKNQNNENYKREYTSNKNSKTKKNKQSKLQQQKLKKKIIMSKFFHKLNAFFTLKIGFIFIISVLYFALTMIVTSYMKENYKKFDSIVEQVNKVYFNSFEIFLILKEQIENFFNSNKKSDLNIPDDSEIERPKLGNALMYLFNNKKYSEESLTLIRTLYNENSCDVLCQDNYEKEFCLNLFSSILTKGMEQAIVQMSIIITNCIDELNSLKYNNTLLNIYTESNFFYYEIFMGHFMLFSFIKTQEIFESFRKDEKRYISYINKNLLIIFIIIYFFLTMLMIYLILSYKNVINSFFNFIGIIPTKFIIDDGSLYRAIINLEQKFY